MATTNLKRISVGFVEIQSGNGVPDHASALGTTYTDIDTGISYKNSNNSSTWSETSSGNYWNTVGGTPVRVSNTSFTTTDTTNTNLYDQLYSRTTILKWSDTGTTKHGMVVSSSYSANNVTVTIIGDTLSSGATMSSLKTSREKCVPRVFAIAGTIATGTDLTGKYQVPCTMKVFGADVYHGQSGTTNTTTYDINKNGTTMFTTKLAIVTSATTGLGFTADSGTELDFSDVISVDCDSVSTTAPVDAYIQLFMTPLKNIYL